MQKNQKRSSRIGWATKESHLNEMIVKKRKEKIEIMRELKVKQEQKIERKKEERFDKRSSSEWGPVRRKRERGFIFTWWQAIEEDLHEKKEKGEREENRFSNERWQNMKSICNQRGCHQKRLEWNEVEQQMRMKIIYESGLKKDFVTKVWEKEDEPKEKMMGIQKGWAMHDGQKSMEKKQQKTISYQRRRAINNIRKWEATKSIRKQIRAVIRGDQQQEKLSKIDEQARWSESGQGQRQEKVH